MKKVIKGLTLGLVLMVGMNIGLVIGKTKAMETIENRNISVVDTYEQKGNKQVYKGFHLEDGDKLVILSDDSFAICNEKNNTYVFQPVELGDWDYEVKDSQQLENIIKTYISMKNTGTF